MAGEWPRRPTGIGSTLEDDCWKIEATYKRVDLRYVFELPETTSFSKPQALRRSNS